jgi:anti-anti-sigma factor
MAGGGSRELELHEEVTDQLRVVSLRGTLDIETAPALEERLSVGASDPDRPLVVDMLECVFIDSVGLAALLRGAKPLQNGEANVAFVAADEGPVRKLLALTAVDRTIPVFATRAEAAAAVVDPG